MKDGPDSSCRFENDLVVIDILFSLLYPPDRKVSNRAQGLDRACLKAETKVSVEKRLFTILSSTLQLRCLRN